MREKEVMIHVVKKRQPVTFNMKAASGIRKALKKIRKSLNTIEIYVGKMAK